MPTVPLSALNALPRSWEQLFFNYYYLKISKQSLLASLFSFNLFPQTSYFFCILWPVLNVLLGSLTYLESLLYIYILKNMCGYQFT